MQVSYKYESQKKKTFFIPYQNEILLLAHLHIVC